MTRNADYSRRYRERKKAEGFRILHGRITDAPHVTSRPGVPPPHGTSARRRSRLAPCECEQCRAADNEAQRQWRARNKQRIAEHNRRYRERKKNR